MRVMKQSPDPLARMHTMTKRQGKSGTIDVKAVLAEDEEFLRALVRTALQEVLEAEMTEALGAEKPKPLQSTRAPVVSFGKWTTLIPLKSPTSKPVLPGAPGTMRT